MSISLVLKIGCIIESSRKLLDILKPRTYQKQIISTSLGVGQPNRVFFGSCAGDSGEQTSLRTTGLHYAKLTLMWFEVKDRALN